MTLKTTALADVASVFLNNDEHAEPVQYRPRDGDFTDYYAVVERQESIGATSQRDGIVYMPNAMLYMACDGTNGPQTVREGDLVRFGNKPPVSTFPTNDADYDTWKVSAVPATDGLGLRTIEVVRVQSRTKATDSYINKRR